MKTTIEQLEDRYLVTLEGELDTVAAADVEKTLQPLYTTNGKDVIIDCEGLEYIASSGLRILISILKGAKAGGSKVVMKNMNEDIKSVFKLTGFINIFEKKKKKELFCCCCLLQLWRLLKMKRWQMTKRNRSSAARKKFRVKARTSSTLT